MRSSRLTFLVGLLLSAAIHATLLWQLPRWARTGSVAVRPPEAYKVAPPGTLPDPPPKPETQLGEAKGVGDAINSSPGDEPQSAPLSRPDQAVWTRDATGDGPGERPSPPQPLAASVLTPPPAAVPTPPVSPIPAFKKPPPPQPKAPPAETPKEAPPQPQQPQPQTPSMDQPPQKPQAPQEPTDPTPPGGRPLPHSDQDSDAFAKEVTVEFKRGQVVAAPGRQIKFTRPRLSIASMVESAEIMLPAKMRIRVSVTPQGSARNVIVVRSTGSRSIDRAFLLAAYESWFEPAKDRAGQPVADEFEFNIAIE